MLKEKQISKLIEKYWINHYKNKLLNESFNNFDNHFKKIDLNYLKSKDIKNKKKSHNNSIDFYFNPSEKTRPKTDRLDLYTKLKKKYPIKGNLSKLLMSTSSTNSQNTLISNNSSSSYLRKKNNSKNKKYKTKIQPLSLYINSNIYNEYYNKTFVIDKTKRQKLNNNPLNIQKIEKSENNDKTINSLNSNDKNNNNLNKTENKNEKNDKYITIIQRVYRGHLVRRKINKKGQSYRKYINAIELLKKFLILRKKSLFNSIFKKKTQKSLKKNNSKLKNKFNEMKNENDKLKNEVSIYKNIHEKYDIILQENKEIKDINKDIINQNNILLEEIKSLKDTCNILLEKEKNRELEREKEKEKETEFQKEKEIQLEKERELQKEKEIQLEREKELQKEKEAQLKKEKDLQKEREIQLEKEKERELQLKRELEKERELKKEKERELQLERERELEKEKELKKNKNQIENGSKLEKEGTIKNELENGKEIEKIYESNTENKKEDNEIEMEVEKDDKNENLKGNNKQSEKKEGDNKQQEIEKSKEDIEEDKENNKHEEISKLENGKRKERPSLRKYYSSECGLKLRTKKHVIFKEPINIRQKLTTLEEEEFDSLENSLDEELRLQEQHKRERYLKSLVKAKILEMKDYIHKRFLTFYYNGVYSEMMTKRHLKRKINIRTNKKKETRNNQDPMIDYNSEIYQSNQKEINLEGEELEQRKKNKKLRDLFYNKIRERKNYLHNCFKKFYYNGIFVEMKKQLDNRSNSNNGNNENPKEEININGDNSKEKNEVKNEIKQLPKSEEIDPEKKERLRKSRNFRKLVTKKAKERLEILRKYFYKFYRVGIFSYVKQKSSTRLPKVDNNNNINERDSQFKRGDSIFGLESFMKNLNNEKKRYENMNKDERDQKIKKSLQKFVYKADRALKIILKNNFEKFNLKSKILSLEALNITKKKNKKRKHKSVVIREKFSAEDIDYELQEEENNQNEDPKFKKSKTAKCEIDTSLIKNEECLDKNEADKEKGN